MIELHLNHRELIELLNIVETMNPPDTLMLSAGTVKITAEVVSGIGSTLSATVPVKVGERWGDWTTTITDERHW
jgi:hypothetical protein